MTNGKKHTTLYGSVPGSRRGIAVLLIAGLVLLVLPQPGEARWNSQYQELPGMISGSDIAKNLAIAGGIAAGAIFVYMKFFRGKSKSTSGAEGGSLRAKDAAVVDLSKNYIWNPIRNPIHIETPALPGAAPGFTLLHTKQNSKFRFSFKFESPGINHEALPAPSSLHVGAERELASFR